MPLGLTPAADAAAEPVPDQAQFAAALQAIDEDRLKTARSLLDGILSGNPSMHRARLELARADYLSMDYDSARREAQRVLDDPNTPDTVRTTVLAFLAQIDADQKDFGVRHKWTPSIYLGMIYDTNVNVGPNRDVVDIGGTPFAIEKNHRDLGAVIEPGIEHTYNPDVRFQWGEHTGYLLWQSSLNGYYRRYFDETDYNLGVATVRTGPVWVVPRHWRATIGLQGDQVWLGDGRLLFLTSLDPAINWQIGDTTELGLEGVLTRRTYNHDRDNVLEGWYKWLGGTAGQYFFGQKLAVKGGAGYFWFDTDDSAERYANAGPDLFIGVVAQAWTNGSVYARVGYRNFDFKGHEPGFSNKRNDDEYRYMLGFAHNISSGLLNHWVFSGDWTHTNNDSNIPIYDFDRDQFNLGLSRSF